ncbi:MAG: ATP-binding protein [Cyanobacteriota bacterium]|jgi:serine/threonine-protein kinase RsbW
METLTIPGNLDSLGVIASYVLDVAQSAGLENKSAYKLRLAVDELVTNIIVHGYQEKGLTGEIQLAAQWDASRLSVRIEDTGYPYDPTQHSLPQEADLAQSLIQRPHGGLGIYLALDGVDELRYERVDDRNRSVLTVNL